MSQNLDCDTWTVIDFGNGPVEVRCTQMGPHEQCICQVFIERNVLESELEVEAPFHNIFDSRAS